MDHPRVGLPIPEPKATKSDLDVIIARQKADKEEMERKMAESGDYGTRLRELEDHWLQRDVEFTQVKDASLAAERTASKFLRLRAEDQIAAAKQMAQYKGWSIGISLVSSLIAGGMLIAKLAHFF